MLKRECITRFESRLHNPHRNKRIETRTPIPLVHVTGSAIIKSMRIPYYHLAKSIESLQTASELEKQLAAWIDVEPMYENVVQKCIQFGTDRLDPMSVGSSLFLTNIRRTLIRNFGFAIPNAEAVETLVGLSPISEIGAGNGYWAWRVFRAGGVISAYDAKLTRLNRGFIAEEKVKGPWEYNHDRFWIYPIETCPPDATASPDRTLFLCWPDYDTDMAFNCLYRYQGKNFVYIGEWKEGCCANTKFFELLDTEWRLEKVIDIPTFFGIHDRFYYFRR